VFYAAIGAGFVAGVSVILAWYFGRFLGVEPCELCIYARWLTAAFSFGCFVLAWLENKGAVWRSRMLSIVMIIGFLSLALSIGHGLLERKIIHLHMACTDSQLMSDRITDAEGFKKLIEDKAPARCDKITWSFLGLSMANWNGLFTLILLGGLMYAQKRKKSKQ